MILVLILAQTLKGRSKVTKITGDTSRSTDLLHAP
ncbi:hypothetical protein MSP7336_04694 [Mycobacterium shimoidei]|uniref:Uncharacterized protein n=1 Tax=Mycobacterium shimoidei TaxID=29313 RepID=A0A375Z5P7_MYCSH|nr:hypothetical protein MSP7336_04694 [Mycobacterium shimoidei]